ncbi:hypothetical protein [Rhizobium sp. BK251]|uniref:hypothetical protein n=1 Tax=Rhizobium sp. BK251 TaxID=2512125 RepID=UPI0010509F3C|nr:hypothetical protein [Rhizobium sp. BK251]TCL69505.1 hypothetical protein EV286_10877 [Rhizobium sp. BK251]
MSGTLAARGTQSTAENASARQRAHAQSRTAGNLDEMADATELQTISPLRGTNWADYSTVALTDLATPRGSVTTELARAEDEAEADTPDLVEDPKDKDEATRTEAARAELSPATSPAAPPALSGSALAAPSLNIGTILLPGKQPQTYAAAHAAQEFDHPHGQTVAPGGKPTEGAASNDCLPSTASATLAWDVVDADKDNWGADVQSLTLVGQVNVKPWPSNPTSMTVPNTANPVDGGNINNTAGSDNNWQAAIDDMADYNLVDGGAGPNWHSTDASHAHEWAHWNTDYVIDSVGSAAGGNWSKVNTDIDALRQPKTTSATAGDAKTALTARVNAQFAKWRSNTIKRWNAIPDTAGVAGSTGYEAGAAVLATLIASVRAYAVSKGWAGAPPPPPAPFLPLPPRPGRDIPP